MKPPYPGDGSQDAPATAGAAGGAWNVVGVAVAGSAHLKSGKLCQDAQAYRSLPNGLLLLALADGAGSAQRAGLGAETAVRAGLEALEAAYLQRSPGADRLECLNSAFAAARRALGELALESGEPLRDFATTLMMAAAEPGRVTAGQIGDGAIEAENPSGELAVLIAPQRGEYANETNFLTQDDALDCIRFFEGEGAHRSLAVMSDGLMRLALRLPSGEPHRPFFQPLFSFVAASDGTAAAQLEEFLASERVCARTDDDKALILAALKNGLASEPDPAGE